MDAYDFANYAKTFSNQKRLINEKYKKNLVVFYNGGKFTASHSLLSHLNYLSSTNKQGPLVDDNETPIWIDSYKDLLDTLLEANLLATTQYYNEFEILRNNRTVKGLVNE